MQWCVTPEWSRVCSGLGLLDALSVMVEPKSMAIAVLVVGRGRLSRARMGSSCYAWHVLFSGSPLLPRPLTF